MIRSHGREITYGGTQVVQWDFQNKVQSLARLSIPLFESPTV